MRLVSRLTLSASLALGALAFASSSAVAASTQYMYIGDYAGNQVVRFDATTGAVLNAPYISVPGAEGVGGTNTLLAVASSNGNIYVYNNLNAPTPTLFQTINTGGTNALRLAISNDGQTLYAGCIAGYPSPGVIKSWDLSSGAPLASLPSPNGFGTWGIVTDPNSTKVLFTTGWADNNTGAGAVYAANANLSSPTLIVANGDHGLANAVGLTFAPDGNSFYVVNGGNGSSYGNPFVNRYAWNGTTASYLNTVDLTGMPGGALNNAFDLEFGPDKNLYVTSQNGACVVKFVNDQYNSIFIPPHDGGLQQAKTIHFSVNNVETVPEPGAVAFGVLAAGSLLGLVARKRRK